MAWRIEIGDVVEIATPIGFAYAQLINEDPLFGEIVRVLPGTFDSRPEDLARLVAGPDRFVVCYLIRSAIRTRLVQRVGHEPLPKASQAFQLMLWGGLRLRDGKRSSWALYDGKRTKLLKELRAEHWGLPIVMNLGHPGLVNAIVNDWHPADELDGNAGLQKLVGPDVVLPSAVPQTERADGG
jgi:hypothetical protein